MAGRFMTDKTFKRESVNPTIPWASIYQARSIQDKDYFDTLKGLNMQKGDAFTGDYIEKSDKDYRTLKAAQDEINQSLDETMKTLLEDKDIATAKMNLNKIKRRRQEYLSPTSESGKVIQLAGDRDNYYKAIDTKASTGKYTSYEVDYAKEKSDEEYLAKQNADVPYNELAYIGIELPEAVDATTLIKGLAKSIDASSSSGSVQRKGDYNFLVSNTYKTKSQLRTAAENFIRADEGITNALNYKADALEHALGKGEGIDEYRELMSGIDKNKAIEEMKSQGFIDKSITDWNSIPLRDRIYYASKEHLKREAEDFAYNRASSQNLGMDYTAKLTRGYEWEKKLKEKEMDARRIAGVARTTINKKDAELINTVEEIESNKGWSWNWNRVWHTLVSSAAAPTNPIDALTKSVKGIYDTWKNDGDFMDYVTNAIPGVYTGKIATASGALDENSKLGTMPLLEAVTSVDSKVSEREKRLYIDVKKFATNFVEGNENFKLDKNGNITDSNGMLMSMDDLMQRYKRYKSMPAEQSSMAVYNAEDQANLESTVLGYIQKAVDEDGEIVGTDHLGMVNAMYIMQGGEMIPMTSYMKENEGLINTESFSINTGAGAGIGQLSDGSRQGMIFMELSDDMTGERIPIAVDLVGVKQLTAGYAEMDSYLHNTSDFSTRKVKQKLFMPSTIQNTIPMGTYQAEVHTITADNGEMSKVAYYWNEDTQMYYAEVYNPAANLTQAQLSEELGVAVDFIYPPGTFKNEGVYANARGSLNFSREEGLSEDQGRLGFNSEYYSQGIQSRGSSYSTSESN